MILLATRGFIFLTQFCPRRQELRPGNSLCEKKTFSRETGERPLLKVTTTTGNVLRTRLSGENKGNKCRVKPQGESVQSGSPRSINWCAPRAISRNFARPLPNGSPAKSTFAKRPEPTVTG